LIETGMTKPIFDNARSRGTDPQDRPAQPLKRAGQPHELAAMGLFSPATRLLTSTARRSRSMAG